MRVRADRDVCCGAGNCVRIAPAVFDQGDDDGLVLLRDPTPRAEHATAVRDAADACPSGAIAVDV